MGGLQRLRIVKLSIAGNGEEFCRFGKRLTHIERHLIGHEVFDHAQSGTAAVYSYPGGRTASGEKLDPSKLTAAHRSLPFGTMVRVTNLRNGRSATVRKHASRYSRSLCSCRCNPPEHRTAGATPRITRFVS